MSVDKIVARSIPEPNSGCWLWLNYVSPDGYGRFRGRMAHRVAYESFVCDVPNGLELDHLCRNRACVNPAHLEIVTHSLNCERGESFNRSKTHCPHGHEYSPKNTYIDKVGRRQCRRCAALRQRRYQVRISAALGIG